MNRRQVLKQVMLAAAVAALAPSCTLDGKKVSIPLKHLKISGDQEELLSQITDTIIPSTSEIPGANTLNLHMFVLKMLDDCYDQKTQEQVVDGLVLFQKEAKNKLGKAFADATGAERESFLKELDGKKTSTTDEVLSSSFQTIKQLTIRGYLTSQYVMEAGGYEFLPGRFNGCVNVSTKKAAA